MKIEKLTFGCTQEADFIFKKKINELIDAFSALNMQVTNQEVKICELEGCNYKEEIEILPCPFCGNKGELNESTFQHGYFYITCPTTMACSARPVVGHYKEKKEAIQKWNTRAK